MKIVIQEYQTSWAADFLKLNEIIQRTLISFNASIDHVGSTSVTGLGANLLLIF